MAEGARLDFEAGASWQLERQVEGFTNTQTVTAFVKSEDAKFMLRCENKDRIMAMFQPEGIISEAGPLFTRYRIGKHSTVKSENWISLYGIAAYIGAKKDEKNRQEIIDLAKSLASRRRMPATGAPNPLMRKVGFLRLTEFSVGTDDQENPLETIEAGLARAFPRHANEAAAGLRAGCGQPVLVGNSTRHCQSNST